MNLPTSQRPTKFCHSCGLVIDAMASGCPYCSAPQGALLSLSDSERRLLPAVVLCAMLGPFGAHRFYAGKWGTGILQLVTLGGLGVWMMIDLVLLVLGRFRDADGNLITDWT